MPEGETTPTPGGKSFQGLEISSGTAGRLGVHAIPHTPLTLIISSLLPLAASCSVSDAASLCRALGCALPTMPIRRTDFYSLLTLRGPSTSIKRGCLLLRLLDFHILYISPWRCVVLFPLHTTLGSASTYLIDRLAHDTAHYEECVASSAAPSAFQAIHPPSQGDPQALLTTTLRTLLESVTDALRALKSTASLDVSRIHNLAGNHGGMGLSSQGDFFMLDGAARASVSAALGAVEGVQASLAALDEACGTGAAGGVRGRHVLASSSSSFFFSPSTPFPPSSPSSSSSSSRRTLSLRQFATMAPQHVKVALAQQQQHTSTSLLIDEVDLGLARMHGELVGEGQTLDDAHLVLKTGMALKRNQLGKLRLALLIAQSCILYATLNEVFHINSGFGYTFPLAPLFANDDGSIGPIATTPNATATGTFQRSSFVLSIASFYEATGFFVVTAGLMFFLGLYCVYKLPS